MITAFSQPVHCCCLLIQSRLGAAVVTQAAEHTVIAKGGRCRTGPCICSAADKAYVPLCWLAMSFSVHTEWTLG
jgi:hypothetical protein